jgi:hypothetical protein
MVQARAHTEVVIAGGGPAAAAIAVSVLSSGIRTLMLVSQRPTFRMAEAIPSAAQPLIEALGLIGLVRQVGIGVKGMENWSAAENPVIREDSFVLVDRTEFAGSRNVTRRTNRDDCAPSRFGPVSRWRCGRSRRMCSRVRCCDRCDWARSDLVPTDKASFSNDCLCL